MKKTFIPVAIACALLVGCGNQGDEFSSIEKQLNEHSQELSNQVAKAREGYLQTLKTIEDGYQASIEEQVKSADANITEFKNGISEQEALYAKECTTEELKGGDQCNNIKEGITEIKNKLAKAESDIKNIKGAAEAQYKSNVSKHKASYKNNLYSLASQAGVKLEQ